MTYGNTQILSPDWIITCDDTQTENPEKQNLGKQALEKHVLKKHSIVIEQDTIKAILTTADALEQFSDYEHTVLNNHVICPGFINMHNHAAMTLFRGMADDLPLMTWLQDHIWPAESQHVSYDFVYHGTRLAIAEMIRSGTTSFSDMYFFPEAAAKAANEAHIRSQLCTPIIDFPTAWSQNADEGIRKSIELIDQQKNQNLSEVAFGPHAPYTVSDDALKKIAILAEELDINIQMHIHETAFEVEEGKNKHSVSPLQRLAELGILSPRLQAVHMTQLTDEEIKLVKTHGVTVVHCPKSNLKLASGFCPIGKLEAHGVNVTIGTDGAASNNSMNMLNELQLSALLAKGVSGNAEAVNAYDALKMATINAAKALGKEQHIGSVTQGKQADLIAIDLSDINTQPVHNPASAVVYSAEARQITHSWVAGKQLMKNRELLTLDEKDILSNTKAWFSKIIN